MKLGEGKRGRLGRGLASSIEWSDKVTFEQKLEGSKGYLREEHSRQREQKVQRSWESFVPCLRYPSVVGAK